MDNPYTPHVEDAKRKIELTEKSIIKIELSGAEISELRDMFWELRPLTDKRKAIELKLWKAYQLLP